MSAACPLPDWIVEARETGRAWAEEHAINREIARGIFIGDIQGAHRRVADVPEERRARAAYHCLEAALDRWAELTIPVAVAMLEHAAEDLARAAPRVTIPPELAERLDRARGAISDNRLRRLRSAQLARRDLKPENVP